MPTDEAPRRINDILKNIASIETYTQGLTAQTLQDNPMAADAVERCLERIAEAARKLGPRFDDVIGGGMWTCMPSANSAASCATIMTPSIP